MLHASLVSAILPWVGILILTYVLYHSWIYPFYISPLRKIPTVPGFPLWGHISALLTHEAGVPQRLWHEEHGLLVRFFLPFGVEVLSVADNDAIKQMTVKNPYNYPYPPRIRRMLWSVLGNGLIVAQGKSHTFQRKALAPCFSTSSVKEMSPIFWRKGLLLSQLWLQELERGKGGRESLEVVNWMNRTTLDIIGEAALGSDIDSLRNSETPFLLAYQVVTNTDFNAFQILRALFKPLSYLPLQMNRELQRARQMICTEASRIVGSKRNIDRKNAAKDIISSLLKHDKDHGVVGQRITSRNLRDNVRTFIAAGHETTATAICWALLHLSKSPEIQERVRAEIRDHMPSLFDRAAREDFEALEDPDRLPYLHNVCRESLRCIPPIPLTIRQSLVDEQLAGYHVPAGTVMWIPINAINRLAEHWGQDADAFDPDRWEKSTGLDTAGGGGGASMTFLQGPKGCIGRKFAEMEMKVLLCCLLSAFSFKQDMSREDPINWKMWKVVLRPRDGIHLKVDALF